jgi:hypothetical protein
MEWEYVSELRPPAGLLFISQVMYGHGETQWKDTGRVKLKSSEKTCPSATSSTTNPTCIVPGANPVLRGERPAPNLLSHGKTYILLNNRYLLWESYETNK